MGIIFDTVYNTMTR